MRNWQLHPKDPFSLILAPDFRTAQEKNGNDTVWELQYESGEYGGISLYTTLSLRALSLRIFPIFSNMAEPRSRLSQFHSPPVIQAFYPDYVHIRLSPFAGLLTDMEFWAQSSRRLVSKVVVNNTGSTQFSGKAAWAAALNPLPGGDISRHEEWEQNQYIVGNTESIQLGFLMNGAPKPASFPYPALSLPLDIYPGGLQEHQWVCEWGPDKEPVLHSCQKWIQKNFVKSFTRLEVLQQRDCFLIESGNPEWDAVLAFSQNSVLQTAIPAGEPDEAAFIMPARHPELGKIPESNEGNWIPAAGYSPKELWYTLQCLPGGADYIRKILEVILSKQDAEGFIPNQLVTTSLQNRLLAYPLLCSITAELRQQTDMERADLDQLYPKLLAYLKQWLRSEHDHDMDGIPEWSHAVHSLAETLPIHDQWHAGGVGCETRWIESPMLASLILTEIDQLQEIAADLAVDDGSQAWLAEQKERLRNEIQSMWDRKKKIFRYRDSATHHSYQGKKLASIRRSGKELLKKNIRGGQRLSLHFVSQYEITRNVRVFLHGKTTEGDTVEEISARQIHWHGNLGFATSLHVFSELESVEVEMMPAGDELVVSTTDFATTDITCLLPIWAGAARPPQAKAMVESFLMKELLQPFGLPFVPVSSQPEEDIYNQVDPVLNAMVIAGLHDYGLHSEARLLFENLLRGMTKNLALFKKFHKLYDASDGYGIGEYNIVNGLAPVKLFLKLCGIRHWHAGEISFSGNSIFEQPVQIQYRGIRVICTPQGNQIFLPGGRTVHSDSDTTYRLRSKSVFDEEPV